MHVLDPMILGIRRTDSLKLRTARVASARDNVRRFLLASPRRREHLIDASDAEKAVMALNAVAPSEIYSNEDVLQIFREFKTMSTTSPTASRDPRKRPISAYLAYRFDVDSA